MAWGHGNLKTGTNTYYNITCIRKKAKKVYRNPRLRRWQQMLKAYKYRIYPTNEQKEQIAKTFGCCRFVYNRTLSSKMVPGTPTGLTAPFTGLPPTAKPKVLPEPALISAAARLAICALIPTRTTSQCKMPSTVMASATAELSMLPTAHQEMPMI